ncbi:hypothetical protein ABZ370_08740 [Streptomyces sp. NPDC005962]|uniref:hypothetical protein n=1 Tax=Streptomyces sp. NPDC005962 TaxID=3154466 RepID=UPI00340F1CF8
MDARATMIYDSDMFEPDGALRDVCVLDTSEDDWSKVIARLHRSAADTHFSTTLPQVPVDLQSNAGELLSALASNPEESARFSTRFGNVWFSCYFFQADEIEFTFDPADVEDADSFHSVADFMSEVGEACGKRVIMTMESNDHHHIPALLEWIPE